jgi:hypothetical protein
MLGYDRRMINRHDFERLSATIHTTWPGIRIQVRVVLMSGDQFPVWQLTDVAEDSVAFLYHPDKNDEALKVQDPVDSAPGFVADLALPMAIVPYEQIQMIRLVPGKDEQLGFRTS